MTTAKRASAWILVPLALLAFALAAGGAQGISIQRNTSVLDADLTVTGGPSDGLPSSLAVGDWTGDRVPDWAACSAANNSCWIFKGKAGAPNQSERETPYATIVGPGGEFGYSVAFVGDVNFDGFGDLAVGAPAGAGSSGDLLAGSVWVFFGRPSVLNTTIAFYDADFIVFGSTQGLKLGAQVEAAGDVNGDSYADFWVSARGATSASGEVGATYLVQGRQFFPREFNETVSAMTIMGTMGGGAFGLPVLGGRDFNRDGWPDVAVSATRARDAANATVGAVYVFLGPLPPAGGGAVIQADQADVQIWGSSTFPAMGMGLAFATNFTKGGASTLLVHGDWMETAFRTYDAVFEFNTSTWRCCSTLHAWDADGLLFSRDIDDRFGEAMAVGDFDGDGRTDVAIGAPNADPVSKGQAGRVYLFYGNVTGRAPELMTNATGWIEGNNVWNQSGSALAVGDLNRDGMDDLLIGAPGASTGTPRGLVYGFEGRPRNRPPTATILVPENATEGSIAQVIVHTADLDHDRLVISWASGNGNFDNGSTATIFSFYYRDDGNYTVRVRVFDGQYAWEGSASLLVQNLPPTCELTIQRPFLEGSNGTVSLVMKDPGLNDTLAARWSGPQGFTVTGSSTLAWYIPPNGRDFSVGVNVTDGDDGAVECWMQITDVNVRPSAWISAESQHFEGDFITLAGGGTDPGDAEDLQFSWRLPDSTVEGSIVTWVTAHGGSFIIELTVSDQDGGSSVVQKTLYVAGRKPDIELQMYTPLMEGTWSNLTVIQRTGASYDPLVITWHVCGITAYVTGFVYPIERAIPGTYCVEVRAVDDEGDFIEISDTMTVVNRPPLATVKVSPAAPFFEGTPLTFRPVLNEMETSLVDDLKIEWQVDNLTIDYGKAFMWTARAGTHRVTVIATDPHGGRSNISFTIRAENAPPVISIQGPTTIAPGAVTAWSATATDISGEPVVITWTIDGNNAGNGQRIEWKTSVPGQHEIIVTARDPSGAESSAVLKVVVESPPSTSAGVGFGWMIVPMGAAIAFGAGILFGFWMLDRWRTRRDREG